MLVVFALGLARGGPAPSRELKTPTPSLPGDLAIAPARARLQSLDPQVVPLAHAFITELEHRGLRVQVNSAWRDCGEQAALYRSFITCQRTGVQFGRHVCTCIPAA
ncbi:MAG: hypothetical protein ABI766_12600, partial [Gemmatimonadales bacterium]